MNLIDDYSRLRALLHEPPLWHEQVQPGQILKFVQSIRQRLRALAAVFLAPDIGRGNQVTMPVDCLHFSFWHDAKISQYDYCFDVKVDLATRFFRINAHILKDGCILNVAREGLVQVICNYSMIINGAINAYSLRINPFTGAVNLYHQTHMTRGQVEDILRFPIGFAEKIESHVREMLLLLDEKLLGKILHLTNEIQLRNILPESFECVRDDTHIEVANKVESTHPLFSLTVLSHLYAVARKVKQIRKFVANSAQKYQFFAKDPENFKIRFLPEIADKKDALKTEAQKQKQKRKYAQNFKMILFSKQVLKILGYYAPISKLAEEQDSYRYAKDLSKIEPTPEEITRILEMLRCENLQGQGRVYSDLYIECIDNEAYYCSGGFAQIYRLLVTVYSYSKPVQGPNPAPAPKIRSKQALIKKSADKQKLTFQKQVIEQIGRGSCLFINKYFNPKIEVPTAVLTAKSFQDSILMEYCQERSLNNFLCKHSALTSLTSKIFFLYQATIGLRYLRDYGVVHLDMKPENLLVKIASMANNNSIALLKIIDYGEAYSKNFIGQKNRGHTCPYAPPEQVNNIGRYGEQSDVFSVGVMILTIIFDLNTTDIKRLGSRTVFESDQRYLRMYSVCVEKCKYLGYEPLMQCLLSLALKCLSPATSQRPLLNWICVIFRSCLFLLDDLERSRTDLK